MNTQNMSLKIKLIPDHLVIGDNKVFVEAENRSPTLCQDLIIRLNPVDNLFVASASKIRFFPISPDETAMGTIDVSVPGVGLATLELRCSWRHQDQILRDDITFSLKVTDSTGEKENQNNFLNYTSSYLKDHYINSLPHWRQIYQLKHKELQHLELQKAQWGGIDVPFRIKNQIDELEDEISILYHKISQAEAYLAGF